MNLALNTILQSKDCIKSNHLLLRYSLFCRPKRKCLKVETVSTFNQLRVETVSTFSKLKVETVSTFSKLKVETVSNVNQLKVETF